MLLLRFYRGVLLWGLAAAMVLAAGAGCAAGGGSGDGDGGDDLGLAWEAWAAIHANYAAADSGAVAGGAIGRVMDLGGLEPYPFLADLGRMRGQIPASVPAGLGDVWRAALVYRADNPGVESEDMARILIEGMVAGLPGSAKAYLTAEQFPEAQERLAESLQGSYLGIGARVVAQEGRILLYPFADSPSEKGGVAGGDVLLAVDGAAVAGATPAEVGARVKGPEGTKVRLRVERAGAGEPLELEVFRGNVELDTVASQLVPGGIGYIRVFRFRENTGQQVFEALERLNRFDMLALILDLRRNAGGSAAAAAETAGQLLAPGGAFRYVEDSGGARREHLIPEEGNRLALEGLPVAALVDEQTVGEAEALAAALQEAGRATLVGAATYGDGYEYGFVGLSDGSALYVPVSRWYTPGGEWVGDGAVQPDILVEYGEGAGGAGGEAQFNAAYEFLDRQLPLFR